MFPVCSICKEEKLVEQMTKNSKRPNGCGSYCKSCDNIRKRKWIEENKDRHNKNLLKAKKKWKRNNPKEQN